MSPVIDYPEYSVMMPERHQTFCNPFPMTFPSENRVLCVDALRCFFPTPLPEFRTIQKYLGNGRKKQAQGANFNLSLIPMGAAR